MAKDQLDTLIEQSTFYAMVLVNKQYLILGSCMFVKRWLCLK